jgi:hypothetical protein
MTWLFMKSPHQKPTIDATTTRHVLSKTTSRAGWITALKGLEISSL